MSIKGDILKSKQLGVPYSTAAARLKKSIMFQLVKEVGKDICYQCGEKIVKEDELSVEHKTPWLHSDNPSKLFFDLNNISFSHLICNSKAGRKVSPNKGKSKYTSKEERLEARRFKDATYRERNRAKIRSNMKRYRDNKKKHKIKTSN